MNKRSVLAVAALAAALSVTGLDGSAADEIAEKAKAYQAELETMIGAPPAGVVAKLSGWKFEPRSAWMTEDAASKDFKKSNAGKTKFTKKEIAEIFGPAGKYKIAVYALLVGTDAATTGVIDGQGMTVGKDATFRLEIYTAVRVVFRDDKLVHVRTWPKMESSTMTGGTRGIR